jgi:hypothetical protein
MALQPNTSYSPPVLHLCLSSFGRCPPTRVPPSPSLLVSRKKKHIDLHPVLEIVVRIDDNCFASLVQIGIWTMNLDSTVSLESTFVLLLLLLFLLLFLLLLLLYKNMKSIDYNVFKFYGGHAI